MRVLGVVDSDSYTKWGASVLAAMPQDWDKRLVLLETPVGPSGRQLAAALDGSGFASTDVENVRLNSLVELVTATRPDVVLLSLRGPVATLVLRELIALTDRPVLVSGLPGISIPATKKAIRFRAQVDLFLLHSKREIREFAELARELKTPMAFGLGALPFLVRDALPRENATDFVFAAQAKVPRDKPERLRMLGWLVRLAETHPLNTVVIKVRAESGEAQTHAERDGYADLLAGVTDAPTNLVVASGPMGKHLESAAGLVTVSSTAAIEAVGRGIPVIAINDFGVSAELINQVFERSDLLASSADLVAAKFHTVSEPWLDDNYFHDPADNNWVAQIEGLVEAHANGERLPRAPFRAAAGGALRLAWERRMAFGKHDRSALGAVALAIGLPAREVVRGLRRVLRWVDGATTRDRG